MLAAVQTRSPQHSPVPPQDWPRSRQVSGSGVQVALGSQKFEQHSVLCEQSLPLGRQGEAGAPEKAK